MNIEDRKWPFAIIWIVFFSLIIVQVLLWLGIVVQPVSFDENKSQVKYKDSLCYVKEAKIYLEVTCSCSYDILINGEKSDFVVYTNNKKNIELTVHNMDKIEFYCSDDAFDVASFFVTNIEGNVSSINKYEKIVCRNNLQELFTAKL